MWLEKEFWPINSQPKPPPFLIIPSLLGIVAATIDEQRKNEMIIITITYTFVVSLFATQLSQIPCLFSHLLIKWNGKGMKKSIPTIGNGKGMKKNHSHTSGTEGNEKNPFLKFGNGKGMKKSISKIREGEGNEKIHSQNSGTGRQ